MATLSDVAREARVSPTTVSRYLNKNIDLPATTRSRIDAAIVRLDYRPNLLAKRLSTGKAEAISLVIPEIANPFFAGLAGAVEVAADRHGYAVYISSTHGSRARELSALERLRDQHVDGLILMIDRPDDGALARVLERHRNVIVLDEDVPGPDLPRIFVENEKGGYLAARHLIEAGHRRIAFVAGPAGMMSVRERLAGFNRAMIEASLPVLPDWTMRGEYSRHFGAATARHLLNAAERPTAVFAASDYVAIGMLDVFRDAGLDVPRDISIIGFDDMPFVDLVSPALTTIRQPIAEMGRLAFSLLLDLLDGRKAPPLTRLPVALVERQSVASPKEKN